MRAIRIVVRNGTTDPTQRGVNMRKTLLQIMHRHQISAAAIERAADLPESTLQKYLADPARNLQIDQATAIAAALSIGPMAWRAAALEFADAFCQFAGVIAVRPNGSGDGCFVEEIRALGDFEGSLFEAVSDGVIDRNEQAVVIRKWSVARDRMDAEVGELRRRSPRPAVVA